MDDNLTVLERVKKALNARNDADLASILGVSSGAISGYKKDGFSRLKLKEVSEKTKLPEIYFEYGIEQKPVDLTPPEKPGNFPQGGERSVQMPNPGNGKDPKPCDSCKNQIVLQYIISRKIIDVESLKQSDDFLKFVGEFMFGKK